VEAVVLNAKIAKGSPWSIGFTLQETVTAVDGTVSYIPFVLTGWTGVGQIRTEAGAAAIIAPLTITVTNAAAGEGEVGITGAVSAAIPATGKTFGETTRYVWDAYLVHATSPLSPMRIFNGSAEVSPSVTVLA
jgi:hypothetical protein